MEGLEDRTTHETLMKLLEDNNLVFDKLEHEPTRTSEESAKVRGVPLSSGAKAMVAKDTAKGSFILFVFPASRKISWKLVKALLNVKKIELASEEEVYTLTKCRPGAVPPFGSVFKIPTYCDKELVNQGVTINFNAGLRGFSVLNLPVKDYLKLENPQIAEFTTE